MPAGGEMTKPSSKAKASPAARKLPKAKQASQLPKHPGRVRG